MNPVMFSVFFVCLFCFLHFVCLKNVVSTKSVLRHYHLLHIRRTQLCIYILLYSNSCFSKTVKETQRQRKEAKLLKQLEKQKKEEAAEKKKLEQRQNRKGSIRLVLVQL